MCGSASHPLGVRLEVSWFVTFRGEHENGDGELMFVLSHNTPFWPVGFRRRYHPSGLGPMTAKSGHPARERSRVRATGTRSSGHLALSPAGCEGRPPRVTEGGSAARRSHDREGRGARLERGGLELCPCDDKEGPVWFTPAGHPGVVHRSSPATGGCEHSSVAAWSERTGAVGGCVVTDEAGDELADAQTWFSSRTLSAAPSHNWDREPVVTPSGGRSPLIPPVRGQARVCGWTC